MDFRNRWVSVLCMTAVVLQLTGVLLGQKMTEPAQMAQLAVSPSRFEIEVSDRPSMHSLKLMNMGPESAQVKVSVVPWTLDQSNKVQFEQPTEDTLDQWMIVNPVQFTVPGNSSQTVRFSIRPRVRPTSGEHRAMIYLEQVLPEESAKTIRVKFKVGVAVYAYVGEIERRGIVHGVDVRATDNQMVALVDIASEGNAHVRMSGEYYVWPLKTFPGHDQILKVAQTDGSESAVGPVVGNGRLPTFPVLAGTRRDIVLNTTHQLEPGEYVLAMIGELSGTPFTRSTSFNVPPPKPKTPALNQVVGAGAASLPVPGSPEESSPPPQPAKDEETADGGGGLR